MIYNDILSQCIMFGDVWRSNVYDVQKLCLRMCLCVLMCFDKFYVFVVAEIEVG